MRSEELERDDFILKTLHSTIDTCVVELEMTNIRINPEGLQWYLDKRKSQTYDQFRGAMDKIYLKVNTVILHDTSESHT